MPSIISGYAYDVFISYRQKDNKYDGWVTHFVEDLKRELEATFKEDLSIYFDNNPNDGLLEMHHVDKSLEGKLKSIVFIPIISQTYCDPRSFAWQHEFCTFNRVTKEDRFGRDIKLAGGNVTSRILPVKINDLDPEDRELFEKELGGFLRAIEFIYKEPGVNRPLTRDDDPRTNLNKTRYRNQINKVALAIKEIITAIKKPGQATGKVSEETGKAASVSESVVEFEKSIAVLPFINDSPDQENTYFINGVMEEILNNLQKIKDLRVISRTSVEQYRDQKKPISEIAQELGVNYIVEGSGQKYGNSFRLRAQLIMADHESHLWGESFQQKITDVEDIFNIQSRIAESIAKELKAVISPEEKQLIEKIPTKDLTAYEAYIKGKFYWYRANQEDVDTALQYFEQAKERDPEFALAHSGIALVWLFRQQMGYTSPEDAGPKMMEAAGKALELDNTQADLHFTIAAVNLTGTWDWKASEEAFKKAIGINPNHADAHAMYSHLFYMTGRKEEAMEHIELALKLDPNNTMVLMQYCQNLLVANRYDDVISFGRNLLEKIPSLITVHGSVMEALHQAGRYEEAFKEMEEYLCILFKDLDHVFDQYDKLGYTATLNLEADTLAEQSKSKYVPVFAMYSLYVYAGNNERALDWLEKAFELRDPNLPMQLAAPPFTNLRNEPRYQELCRKLKIHCKPE